MIQISANSNSKPTTDRAPPAALPHYKWRVFLSYSHADKKWGEWLYKRLDRYQVDEALVGQLTERGRVPNRLRPIFRDREGLSAGGELRGKIDDELAQSAALVVVCSQSAARSPYVKHEIRTFKRSSKNERVFCFIVDGEPGDPSRECFPETLLQRFDAEGEEIGPDQPTMAADARPHGDGTALALSKLIAGLLGVPLGSIWQRERQEQRRRLTMMWGMCGLTLSLAAGAGVFGVLAHRSQARGEQLVLTSLDRTSALIRKTAQITREYGVPSDATVGYLDEAEKTLLELKKISGERPEWLLRRAQLNLGFAEVYGTLGQFAKQSEKAKEAHDILLTLTELPRSLSERFLASAGNGWRWARGMSLDDDDTITSRLERWRMRYVDIERQLPHLRKRSHGALGQAYLSRSTFTEALAQFNKGLAVVPFYNERVPLTADDHIIDAKFLLQIAHVHHRKAEYVVAIEFNRRAIAQLASLKGDVRTSEGLQTLADAYIKAADLHRIVTDRLHGRNAKADDYNDAVANADEGLQLANLLYNQQPKNSIRAQLLASGYMVQGDIRKRQRDFGAALIAYQQTRDILQRLYENDANNAFVKNDLAYAYMKVGETQREWPGRPELLPASVEAYERAVELFEQLRRLPGFTPARRNTWLALWGLELPLERLQQWDKMLTVRKRKLDLAKENNVGATHSPSALRDLTQSHIEVGDLLFQLHRFPEAALEYDAVLGHTKDLPDDHPSLVILQRRRIEAYYGQGRARFATNQSRPAYEAFSTARRLGDAFLNDRSADGPVLQMMVQVTWSLSEAQVQLNDPRALASCRESQTYLQRYARTVRTPGPSARVADQLRQRAEQCDAREKQYAH